MTAHDIVVVTCSSVCALLLASCGSEAAMPKRTTIEAHTSRSSLDWGGTYLGKAGEAWTDEGRFVWDDPGQTITLTAQDGSTQMYDVGENLLIHLDRSGRRITGDLAGRYLLVEGYPE